jgi:anti-repressor protein
MKNLEIFKNEEFGEVRIIQLNKEPYFCMIDICKALEIKNVSDARKRLGVDGVVSSEVIDSLGREQKANFINEPNMYKLIFQSRKDSAERFTDWVTAEVLPSIRKHDMYATDELLENPDLLIQVATALKEEKQKRKQLEEEAEENKPKVEFFDAVADSKSAIAIGDVAKVLGIRRMGRNNLFEFLRDKGVLMQNNQPYQSYIDRGYFRVIEQKYIKLNGETVINFKTLVYQKGVDYIRRIVEKEVA